MKYIIIVLIIALVILLANYIRIWRKTRFVKREILSFNVMICWVERVLFGYSLVELFKKRGIEKFGLYGMGKTGILLIRELEKEGLKPDFIIEKNPVGMDDYKVPVIAVREVPFQENTDTIIICAVNFTEEMVLNLRANGFEGKIVLLEDLLANWR